MTKLAAAASSAAAAGASASSPKSRKVMVFVEPSPFSHISGMRNRFLGLIESLDQEGDEVVVVTPCCEKTKEYKGVRVISVLGLQLPFYASKTLLLGTALSFRVMWELLNPKTRPDLIHTSSPGMMVFTVMVCAKLLRIPLVVSYHTHIPEYIPRYNLWTGLVAPMWALIKMCSRWCNLCLVTSSVMQKELADNGCKQLDLWQRGVDTKTFNPSFRSEDMKKTMTGGKDGPLLVHVGRLGAEKNIKAIKLMLEAIPGSCLAIVGDGPQRAELEEFFQGTNTKFMGMMRGDALSQAYASADVFVMPSESETLGFVVLEAMASKAPVVSVAAGGLTDIITEDGKMGLLYQPGDYDTAIEHIKKLVSDAAFREKIAEGGYSEVQKWSFHASNVVLREKQYTRAVRRQRLMERFRSLLLHVSILSFFRRVWHAITHMFSSGKSKPAAAMSAV